MRFINHRHVIAAHLTTPEDNPLVTDNSRLMDVWLGGSSVHKQMFKKISREEQDVFVEELLERGFVRSGNLLLDPEAVHFAEMESTLLGGIVTIGYQENGKPVELKVNGNSFAELCQKIARK